MKLLPEKLQDYAARLTVSQLCAVTIIVTACMSLGLFFIIINPQRKSLIVRQQELRRLACDQVRSQQQLDQRCVQMSGLREQHALFLQESMSMSVHEILQIVHRLLYQQPATITAADLGEIKQHTGYWSGCLRSTLHISFEQLLLTLATLQSTQYCMAIRELTIVPGERELQADIKLKLYGRTI